MQNMTGCLSDNPENPALRVSPRRKLTVWPLRLTKARDPIPRGGLDRSRRELAAKSEKRGRPKGAPRLATSLAQSAGIRALEMLAAPAL